MKDFFISYHSADINCAEWIISVLEEADYTTKSHAWDSVPVNNAITEFKHNAEQTRCVIILQSQAYFDMPFSIDEWFDLLSFISQKKNKGILSVQIQDCFINSLGPRYYYIDLEGKTRDKAKKILLKAAYLCSLRVTQSATNKERQRFINKIPRNIPIVVFTRRNPEEVFVVIELCNVVTKTVVDNVVVPIVISSVLC